MVRWKSMCCFSKQYLICPFGTRDWIFHLLFHRSVIYLDSWQSAENEWTIAKNRCFSVFDGAFCWARNLRYWLEILRDQTVFFRLQLIRVRHRCCSTGVKTLNRVTRNCFRAHLLFYSSTFYQDVRSNFLYFKDIVPGIQFQHYAAVESTHLLKYVSRALEKSRELYSKRSSASITL